MTSAVAKAVAGHAARAFRRRQGYGGTGLWPSYIYVPAGRNLPEKIKKFAPRLRGGRLEGHRGHRDNKGENRVKKKDAPEQAGGRLRGIACAAPKGATCCDKLADIGQL
jgi:hypothetical protein